MAELKSVTHQELKGLLKSGSVTFYFKKVSGALRLALGTLDLGRVPQVSQPKGGKGPANCTTYYDLEKGAWRAVSLSKEVWINS